MHEHIVRVPKRVKMQKKKKKKKKKKNESSRRAPVFRGGTSVCPEQAADNADRQGYRTPTTKNLTLERHGELLRVPPSPLKVTLQCAQSKR